MGLIARLRRSPHMATVRAVRAASESGKRAQLVLVREGSDAPSERG